MLDALTDFIRSLGVDRRRESGPDDDDPRVAAAALLHHVAKADGVMSESERLRLGQALATEFGLDAKESGRIAEAGQTADAEAIDLYRFTSTLKSELDEASRIRFVALLWDVTYADGRIHELEDNLVWRIAELLGVSSKDRMAMKREVAGRGGAVD